MLWYFQHLALCSLLLSIFPFVCLRFIGLRWFGYLGEVTTEIFTFISVYHHHAMETQVASASCATVLILYVRCGRDEKDT